MDHGTIGTRHGGQRSEGHGGAAGVTRRGHGGDSAESHHTGTGGEHGGVASSRSIQQLTMASGYLAVILLAVTLLLGPANLLLRRRNPISSYLRRDIGIWAATFSAIHVTAAVFIHVSHGSRVAATVLHFFVNESGRVLMNSFGLGNWTGLAALVIALGLLATSSDVALRTMKAKPWKWVQRLTYVLFGLVVLHAFFYGALLRITSAFTVLLILSTTAVVVGQLLGVWLWHRRHGAERPGWHEREDSREALNT
jgi:sulfoxide reductase heme-binding subunit YedZ